MKFKTYISRIYGKVLLSALLVLVCFRSVAISDSSEYSIKAMFLLNFIKYFEWPIENNKPIIKIGIVGESEMFDALLTLAAQRSAEGQKVEINKVDEKNANLCQIIFISNSQNNKIDETIKKLSGKGVLIISEDDKCKTKQAGINLFNHDNKIRFEINLTPVKSNGMKVSSKLIELASAVNH